jgi:hypothetical protein
MKQGNKQFCVSEDGINRIMLYEEYLEKIYLCPEKNTIDNMKESLKPC